MNNTVEASKVQQTRWLQRSPVAAEDAEDKDEHDKAFFAVVIYSYRGEGILTSPSALTAGPEDMDEYVHCKLPKAPSG